MPPSGIEATGLLGRPDCWATAQLRPHSFWAVASDDFLGVFDGVGGVEDVPEALLGVADGAFGVWVVATPEHVVDTD